MADNAAPTEQQEQTPAAVESSPPLAAAAPAVNASQPPVVANYPSPSPTYPPSYPQHSYPTAAAAAGSYGPPTHPQHVASYPPYYSSQYSAVPQQPSHYQHLDSSHPLGVLPHADDEDENWLLNSAKASVLLTTGGMIGLAAAAAVRWLNGGDFCLFPPAMRNIDGVLQGEEPPPLQQQQRAAEAAPADQPSTNEQTEENRRMIQEVRAVVEQVRTHTERQEKSLQRLTNEYEKGRTDQFVNLLRKDEAPNQNPVLEKLIEIQSELVSLREKMDDSEWEGRLSAVLKDLSLCMDRVSKGEEITTTTQERHTTTAPHESPGGTSLSLETSLTVADDSISDDDNKSNDFPTLGRAIRRIAQENKPQVLRAGAQVLYLYIVNLSNNPRIPRYRKIFTCNETFQKVESLKGGKDLLIAVGFVENGTCLEWLSNVRGTPEEGESMARALESLKSAEAALKVLKSGSGSSSGASSRDSDAPTDLTSSALAAAAAVPNRAATATPPPPPQIVESLSSQPKLPPVLLKTPEIGSIASPPATKKHFMEESGDFPPLHPLSKVGGMEASNKILEAELSQHSPIRGEDLHDKN